MNKLTPGGSRIANCTTEVRERNDHPQLRTTPSLAGGAEETGAMTRWPFPPTLPGFRCRTVLGDYRPQPTTCFRCEGCGAGAYRPLTPEEPVLCNTCLEETVT